MVENTTQTTQHREEINNHSEHQHHAETRVDTKAKYRHDMNAHSEARDEHPDHDGHNAHDMHTEHEDHGVDHTGHETTFRNRFWVSLVLTLPVLLFSSMIQDWFGFAIPEFLGSRWIGPIFATAIYFYGGLPFLQMARPEVRNRKPGMMTLISLAITVAFAYSLYAVFFAPASGFFWEMATLIDVMLLGHWIEMRSVRQASGALNELAKLMPDTAERILPDGTIEEMSVSVLKNGDLVLMRPGASFPSDGEVVEGYSQVNESMITGESKPISKEPGDKVIGGTVNGDGSLRVRITATGEDTALAGIMRLVKEAQQSKSETQILADKAAGWLFYIAVAAAVLTSLAWIIAIGFDLDVLERAVTVLVIACPHALGLAIPLVVAISTSLGAGNGILVRNRLALEEARELDTVIFDKTGTLTEGEFGVVRMTTVDGLNEDQALALATAVEGDSEHLIAKGIRRKAEQRDVDIPQVREFEALKGRGIRAIYDGRTIHVGGPRLLEMLELGLPDKLARFTHEAGDKGHTVVYLVDDQRVVAAFALSDLIRPESERAINRLHEMGVEVAMLTGDSESVAKAVAQELGIVTYFSEILPEHKDHKVAELQKQGRRVAMVGDGVNDAPALTRADVGIAIGSGTDVAIESADIILVQNNPLDVVKILELSKATYRKMTQNLVWATAYNIVAIPLAAGILTLFGSGFLLSPAIAALFMSLSTVIVAVNAQLLRREQQTLNLMV
ncbi:MAG: copper-translocating P-type ATPase [Anaerolineaceae bacterium]|nr:MAG: copper-translocating P-type ATPase [Anaerolineaceae bacterium]